MKRSSYVNIFIVILSFLISIAVAEVAYRKILFSNNPKFADLRNPGDYADYFSDDDYWKLYYLFSGEFTPPDNPHPVLGWVSDFDRDSYIHNRASELLERRPVLLYGDSFAGCVPQVECFEDILNKDQEFSKNHYLLNYGAGGYGVDQIYLLFKHSADLYKNPFVIISMMTMDLDRSILSVRTGQKPYFRVRNDQLILQGIPIHPNPEEYFTNNPPEVPSYLFRKLLYGDILPQKIRHVLKNTDAVVRKKKELNKKIILTIVDELKAKKLDFLFVVFHPHAVGINPLDDNSNWRDQFLQELLIELEVPYVWSKKLFELDTQNRDFSFDEFIIPGNYHPTTYFNNLIAQEIKKYILHR